MSDPPSFCRRENGPRVWGKYICFQFTRLQGLNTKSEPSYGLQTGSIQRLRGCRWRIRRRVLLGIRLCKFAALLLLLAIAMPAAPATAEEAHHIGPNREAEVLALLAPHNLGDDVLPGWRIMTVAIEPTLIRVGLEDAQAQGAELLLENRGAAPNAPFTSTSFAITIVEGEVASGPAAEALARLITSIQANDKGSFWTVLSVDQPGDRYAGPRGRDGRDRGGTVGVLASVGRPWSRLSYWLLDGVVLQFLGLVFLLGVVRKQLRGAPPWIPAALAGVLLLGTVYRLFVPVQSALGVWPYSRMIEIIRVSLNSWVFDVVNRLRGEPLFVTDLAFNHSLIVSTITPLVVFAHAWHLFRDARPALLSAGVMATLANHIRFSQSEVAFISSLALSSLCFVCIYTALRDDRRGWRMAAYAVLLTAMPMALAARPLNMAFVPLFFATCFVLAGAEVPKSRKLLLGSALLLMSIRGGLQLLQNYNNEVEIGLAWATITNFLSTFFDFRLNTLVNPAITSPLHQLAAAAGAFWLYRSDRKRLAFLVSWLAIFYVTHGIVTTDREVMQGRYQLHLAVPFTLLAGYGLFRAAQLTVPRFGVGSLVAASALLATVPLMHLPYERDVAYNDFLEWQFAIAQREVIPAGCTILEYGSSADGGVSIRYRRLGEFIEEGRLKRRWKSVLTGGLWADSEGNHGSSDAFGAEAAALVAAPPECLYTYVGYTCYSHKLPDEALAPACQEFERLFLLEPVASVTFPNRHHDRVIPGRRNDAEFEVTLRLDRVVGVRRSRGAEAPHEEGVGPGQPAGEGGGEGRGGDGEREDDDQREAPASLPADP